MRTLNTFLRSNIMRRAYCTAKSSAPNPTGTVTSKVVTSSDPGMNLGKVTGLSSKILGKAEPVGPGAAKSAEYKVPEYFNYNKMSYFEAEVEMLKYRCPQPSALK